jgi:hypothetical protein
MFAFLRELKKEFGDHYSQWDFPISKFQCSQCVFERAN